MSSKVDDRIVNMKFNNDQFEKGVAETNKSLEGLKKGLNLKDAAKSLGDLSNIGKNFSLSGLADGVSNIASKFSALSVIGITALSNIANKAIDAGMTLLKSLTIDPIKAGLNEYELKMGSIQTILANTSRFGTKLGDVTGALDELNAYADKTIYNFGDMTKNIGLFTNAGIRVEDATAMIKGFSNEAAASGTSAQGAAGAAYQLSQALSAGTIRLMDWRSLTNAGMGNKNMQNGLIEVADAMGMLNSKTTSAKDIQSNFNASLEKNWLSADVMSSYLKVMAEDTYEAAKAQALSLGLSEKQADALAKQAVTANEAATKVRTWTQLIGTLQEGVGSGWAQTFDILIGDFDEATELWTAVSDELGKIIGGMSDSRNKLLQTFKDIGGRDAIIASIANIWKALKNIVTPIQSAFKDIFPPVTAGQLAKMVKTFRDFTETLKPTGKQMALIKRTFKGLFAVLDIGWMIIKQVVDLFGRLFGAAAPAAGGILSVTASIGDFLVGIRDSIKNGEGFAKIFEILGNVLVKPIQLLGDLGQAITNGAGPVEFFAQVWENVANALKKVWEFLAPVGEWIVQAFKKVKDAVVTAFESMGFNGLIGLLNVGAVTGLAIIIKKAFDKIMGIFDKVKSGPGLFDTIKGAFSALTDTFKEMQTTLKSAQLMAIAIAIGILTASVIALSYVDTGKLFIVLGAMTIMFGQLAAMLLAIDHLTKTVKTTKMIGTAIALGILAGAMVLMSTAVLIMSTMDWNELARGLTGMAVSLGILVGATLLLDKVKYKMMESAGAIFVLSTSMVILAAALKIMSTLSWDDILRSVSVLAASVAIMVAAGQLAKKGVKGAGALIAMGIALAIVAGALKVFSTMSWDDVLRSMTVMAASIAILVGALLVLDTLKFSPIGAATMIAMAIAMNLLIIPLKVFSEMSWEGIGKALVMLAGSLAILAGAMALMGIPLVALGGLALFVVSAGLMMLAPALAILGGMSWEAIGRGLVMLGASIAILAVGGLLLIPASVGFLLLGAAIMMIGTGAFLAGTGLMMIAAGILAIAGAAAVGSEAFKMVVMTIIELIPEAMAAFAQGIIDFAVVIAEGGAEFTAAMSTLIGSLIDAIDENGPKLINTLFNLISQLVSQIEKNLPKFITSGARMITAILNGLAKETPKMARAAANLIIAFMNAMGKEIPRIVDAGAKMVIDLVNGIADSIDRRAAELGKAGGRLASAIIRGMVTGIGAGVGEIVNAARNMAENALNAAKNLLGIHSPSKEFVKIGKFVVEGFVKGLTGSSDQIEAAFNNMKTYLKDFIADTDKDIKAYQKRQKELNAQKKENSSDIKDKKKEIADAKKRGRSTKSLEKQLSNLEKKQKKTTDAIKQNNAALKTAQDERKKASAAYTNLTKNMVDEKKALQKLSVEYDEVTTKLEDARKTLANATKTRDDYNKSITDQFGDMPSIDEATKVSDYIASLTNQVEKTVEFTEKLQTLRSMGINDKLYKELMQAGAASIPFMDNLLEQGAGGIAEINMLGDQLDSVAANLGKSASTALYQAAVDSAAGLVKGLEDQQDAIAAQMEKIAKTMVDSIKKQLGIKSPSKVLEEVGKYSTEGLAKGLTKKLSQVEDAGKKLGDSAINSVEKSISKIADSVAMDMNMQPVIRPILDLSAIQKDSGLIDGMLRPPSLKVDGSYESAVNASNMQRTREDFIKAEKSPELKPIGPTFIQNNYSPKALSNAEIYRRTKNQLSEAKKELTTTDA